jgi:hypothetical protein
MLQKQKELIPEKGVQGKLTTDEKAKEVAQLGADMLKKLSNNFKSARQLKLTTKQYEALVKTLELIESGGMKFYKKFGEGKFGEGPLPEEHVFNMSCWGHIGAFHTCGSVCCIGGTAEVLVNERVFEGGHSNPGELRELFYKWIGDPTPEQAGKVLRHYLETGVTDWKRVMGDGKRLIRENSNV